MLNGGGQSGNGSFQSTGGAVSWGGEIVINDDSLAMNLSPPSLAIPGKLTGSGSFRFGRGAVTISNAGHDFGAARSWATQRRNLGALLGGNGVIPDGSFVQILGGPSSKLDLNGRSETIGSLSGPAN